MFFDLEEQRYWEGVFARLSFSATVEIMKYGITGLQKVNLLNLSTSEAMRIISVLDTLKVRETMTVREGYWAQRAASESAERKMNHVLGIQDYMKRYPNLHRLRSKKQFAIYMWSSFRRAADIGAERKNHAYKLRKRSLMRTFLIRPSGNSTAAI